MFAAESMTAHQTDAGQVLEFSARHAATPFKDNAEHLTALEEEARAMLKVAWFARGGQEEGVCPKDARANLEKMRQENRQRELSSACQGIVLNMSDLCRRYELTDMERDIVLLLAMRNTAPNFIEQFKLMGFDADYRRGEGITAGTLLNIITPDYSEQLKARQCFSIEGTLIRERIVYISDMDETESILNQVVCLLERFVRFVIGDNNLYMTAFRYIKREHPQIGLDQVVLPEGEKERVVKYLESFFSRKRQGNELDDFYGYGTGLTMLFYGPSGAGKTMLAQALANHCNCQLFSLRVDQVRDMPVSYEEVLSHLFREATLQGGIVLLDEADDVFSNDSRLSRSLLLEIEKARCVVILATNKAVLLDPALERRLTIKLSFRMPGAVERKKIWQALLPPNIGLDRKISLDHFADRYRVSGGIIKNCLLMAATHALGADPERPIIMKEILDEALETQTVKAFERDGVCSAWDAPPELNMEVLTLRNRESILRAANVYRRLQEEGLGLSVVISSCDIATGRQAAALLARAADLSVREFNLSRLMSKNLQDEVIHPVTQEKVATLRYAFALAEEGGYVTLACDYDNNFDAALNVVAKDQMNRSILLEDLKAELRGHKGLFILVCRPLKNKLPHEFNITISLTPPEPAQQLAAWQTAVGQAIDENDLRQVVLEYPLQVLEIEHLARQARILSILDNGGDELALQHLHMALERHKGRRDMPLLFGE